MLDEAMLTLCWQSLQQFYVLSLLSPTSEHQENLQLRSVLQFPKPFTTADLTSYQQNTEKAHQNI